MRTANTSSGFHRAAVSLMALALAACSSLPDIESHRPSPMVAGLGDTALAQIVARSTPEASHQLTGLRLLPNGVQAFDARIALARHAQRTLELQTYVLAPDTAGRQLLRELRDAAARGVRVRLLLDDLHSADAEALLAGLAAHDNVEVRLFNPLPVRGAAPLTRLALSPAQFEQLHRRMHNKLFIADGHVAISGGRNIGDEYFMQAHASNFVDMDLLTTGAALPMLSQVFERYWHSEHAVPLAQLRTLAADGGAARERFDVGLRGTPAPAGAAPHDVLGYTPVSTQLDEGQLALLFADVQVLADAPEKVALPVTLDDSALGHGLRRLGEARSEVVIVSPYFIPGVRGMAMIREATRNNVRVTLLTNSMAATDEPMVHRAYSRYRQAMLDLGVNIHELSPGLSRKAGILGDFRSSDGRLHAKVAVADRRWVLMGSMNMDGRSALANTELGLLIDSPALALELRSLLERAHASSTYRLRQAPGGIEWISRDGQSEVVQRDEPGADWGQRLKLSLMSMLISEELL